MPGAVIGKRMNLGYIGKVTRDADLIVDARVVSDTEGDFPISFGAAVFLNTDNTYRGALATDATLGSFVGIAIAEVKQATQYLSNIAQYEKNQVCDVLTRGTIIVPVSGTPTAGGAVYLRTAETGVVYEDGKIGDFEAATDTGNVLIPNAVFTTGYVDGNNVAEITLQTKNLI